MCRYKTQFLLTGSLLYTNSLPFNKVAAYSVQKLSFGFGVRRENNPTKRERVDN